MARRSCRWWSWRGLVGLLLWCFATLFPLVLGAQTDDTPPGTGEKHDEHGYAVKLRSRPTRPARAKFYPALDLLNCDGANFSSSWSEFRAAAAENAKNGFPKDESLYQFALRIKHEHMSELQAGSMKMPEVLTRQIPVTRLAGFCLYGFATALFLLFRHDFMADHLLTIPQALGWAEWPLDFMESSDWPTLWRIVPLHVEQFNIRGDASWSEALEWWGDDELLLPRPRVVEVQFELLRWLDTMGSPVKRRFGIFYDVGDGGGTDAAQRLARTVTAKYAGKLQILVLGHHLGSSMEPFTMLSEALKVGAGVQIVASFCGQRHPKPWLVCQEFGYCDQDPELETWFAQYESRWIGEFEWMATKWNEALTRLAAIVGANEFMMRADLFVCGGPAWFCTMLRAVRPAPMLMYFAWPIAPLVPADTKPHVLTQVQTLGQAAAPPVVIVVANWILAAQFAAQVRLHVPVQRPHGLYANRTYAPVPAFDGKPRVMVTRVGQWARESGVALLEQTWLLMESRRREDGYQYPLDLVFLSIRIRGTNTNRPLSYAEFASFHAVVFWPWDVMMLLFNELYTMTMPLLVPERRWMHQIMFHALVHSEVNWWHLRADKVSGALPTASAEPFPLPHLPWIGPGSSVAEAAYWYELTDFVQFPHITNFGSLPDMLDKLLSLDIPTIRMGMRRFNTETLHDSLGFYRDAAAELLAGSHQ